MSALTTRNPRSRPLPLESVCSFATSDFFSFFCGWPFFVASAFRFEAGCGEDGDMLWRVERSQQRPSTRPNFWRAASRVPQFRRRTATRGTFPPPTLRRQNGMFHHIRDGIPGLMNSSRPLESSYRSFCRAPEPWAGHSTRPAGKPRRVRHQVFQYSSAGLTSRRCQVDAGGCNCRRRCRGRERDVWIFYRQAHARAPYDP